MTTTAHLGLQLPELSDNVDITKITTAFSVIDNAIAILDDYVSSSSQAQETLTDAVETLETTVSGKINTSDIVNDLNSTDTNKPLSANQGKELADRIANKGVVVKTSVSLPASGWSNSAPYTQTVNVAGIIAADALFVDVDLSSATVANYSTIMGDWGCINRVTNGAGGTVTAYCYEMKPTNDVSMLVEVIR